LEEKEISVEISKDVKKIVLKKPVVESVEIIAETMDQYKFKEP
jgi:hypothetical protein